MSTLTNKKISDTYKGLLKTADETTLSATPKAITDGDGNNSGVLLDNAGNLKVNNVVEFGSLKDAAEDITIEKFVDEADGIANNDNDTSLPTSAAVKDYVDTKITAEDLDFSGNSGTGDVDLDSEVFAITGSNGISTTALDNTLDIDGSTLQTAINTNAANITTNATNISQNDADIATNASNISTNASNIASNDTDIATNAANIATNVTNISTNQSNISTNATNIATNTTDIASNAADIASNDTDISNLQTSVSTNTTDIASNAADISTNSTAISTNASGISTNAAAISTNATDIATNSSNITTNAANIATNTTNIATNTTDIATNVTDIATNANNIASNDTDIATNASNISSNATNIATNAANISSNDTDIATNAANIATNTTNISTNATNIASNDADISTLQTDVSTNTTNIANNGQDIATNTTNISTNATNIASNDTDIAANASNISTNTTNISTNATNIASNDTDIATNAGNISTNTSNISTNTSNIATNTSNISGNSTDIITNENAIQDLQLDKVDKAGDTMTGNLKIENTSGYPRLNIGDIDSVSNSQAMAILEMGNRISSGYSGGTEITTINGLYSSSVINFKHGVATLGGDIQSPRGQIGSYYTGTSNDYNLQLAHYNATGSQDNYMSMRADYTFFQREIRIGGNSASNGLDDYEEGSYNVQFKVGSVNYGSSNWVSGGGLAWTDNSQYVKVGRKVTLFFDLEYRGIPTAISSSTASLFLTNLPFTMAHGGGGNISFSWYDRNTSTSANPQLTGGATRLSPDGTNQATQINLEHLEFSSYWSAWFPDSMPTNYLPTSPPGGNIEMFGQFTYFTDN